ncbi:F-box/kelch-repeat protein At3g23880-like [Rhododendron vialii]|uniref:F-box/kelch-repeat protein At3g23880-like n=1 Tax=Rhododendron vialii TaxID=182163 RepID=UPI00265DFDC3|nr:F-box/kelch-repeat protein At3g23880-like [Rhododendron vialii]
MAREQIPHSLATDETRTLTSTDTDYTHHRLFLSVLSPGYDNKSCSLHSMLNEQSDTAVDLDCPSKASNCPVRIVGSCDGLVCVAIDSQVFIWNPSTRNSKRLTDIPHPPFISYGFGYDESTDDYKGAGFFGKFGTSGFEVEVKVYALRTPSWRRIEGSPHRLPSDGLGTYLYGALHWTGRSDSNVGSIIVSVDLVKEAHGEVLEPD